MHGASNMLSSGSATSKTLDWIRGVATGRPSTVTDFNITPSTKRALAARMSATVRFSGPCPHTFGVLKLNWFATGKKRTLSAGTEQARVTVPPKKTPARNHIEPLCPTTQFPAVVYAAEQ